MESGKVNTVICTALDRVSRSVKDFLNFFEILNKHNVEFVCLKQNYDTTSSQGKLFITIMMALAEFEREQTSERNKDATLARAERGLWNGGRVLGYDLDPSKKGHLVVNENEKALVQFAFNTYLQCGSIFETMKRLNQNGFRTKEYTSRRNKFVAAKKFAYTTVHRMLTNCCYIGQKEVYKINKAKEKCSEKERYRTVKATWDPIIDEKTFHSAQLLIHKNCDSKHNATRSIRHTYILNNGLLWCEHCGTEMEGRSGTGKAGICYYYYVCKNEACMFKVPADEIEGLIVARLKQLATQKDTLEAIIQSTNAKLQTELPQLVAQRTALKKDLEEVKSFASGIMDKWTAMANDDGAMFIKEKLDHLGKRRREIEAGLVSLEEMISEIERESVDQELVKLVLERFGDIYEKIQPYQQKEAVRLVLHKAILGKTSIKIALYGQHAHTELLASQANLRFGTSEWRPHGDSNPGSHRERVVS
jgi:site-specific DNA recombinase